MGSWVVIGSELAGGARRSWKCGKDQSRSWKCGSLEVHATFGSAASIRAAVGSAARWRCTPHLEVRQVSEPQLEVRLGGGARRSSICGKRTKPDFDMRQKMAFFRVF
ncbi:uncharacterized protein HKW66_Vig0117040 [Vigna angularis]|uniref:Uncharacterized protein n=1 Tax=Phaseolus angularis TaxID=3914 RepID=A0A8T0JZ95_PHAAN|nr:uncharacterized protein HKW66_Vig0117040 [Vigna angularis]